MKRGLKYVLAIGLVILTQIFSHRLPWEEVRACGWFADTLWSAVVNGPLILLFHTAGYDPKLKGWISLYAKILFWAFSALFVVGRIVPYVFA